MSEKTTRTVYIGNLDEKVSERVLYDILIQAGRVVDLYIPRDKETEKAKGFAFAEYETEEIADYAVRLFTGLVTLYNRTLRFGISGQDKQPASNTAITTASYENSNHRARHQAPALPFIKVGLSHRPMDSSTPFRGLVHSVKYEEDLAPPGVTPHLDGYRSHIDGNSYDYSRRVFGATMDSINRPRSRRHDTNNPISYPSY